MRSPPPRCTARSSIARRASRSRGAMITVGSELAASDDDGTFTVVVPPGRYTLEVTAAWLVMKREPLVVRGDAELMIEVEPAATVGGEQIEVVDHRADRSRRDQDRCEDRARRPRRRRCRQDRAVDAGGGAAAGGLDGDRGVGRGAARHARVRRRRAGARAVSPRRLSRGGRQRSRSATSSSRPRRSASSAGARSAA